MSAPSWGYSFRSADFNGESRRDRKPGRRQHLPELDVSPETMDPCERGPACAGRKRNMDTMELVPAPASQHLCPSCQDALATALTELPGAYARLALASLNPARNGPGGTRRPPGSRVPVNVHADALMRETADITAGWAARVRNVPQLALTRHAYPHRTADQVREDCRVLALHLQPLLALPVAPVKRTWTWNPGDPMPPDIEDAIGGLDAVHGGDGWVTAFTSLHGGDAGCELLDLRRRAAKLLRETPAPPEILDGVPCRDCEAMSLERAELPAGAEREGEELPYSRCTVGSCRDTMTRKEYEDWTRQYAAWASGDGIVLTCTRCEQDRCTECALPSCACDRPGHAAA